MADITAWDILNSSCGRCDHDEAEGGVIDHCDACCRRIVTDLYAMFKDHETAVTKCMAMDSVRKRP